MPIAGVFGIGGSSVIARFLGERCKEYAGKTLNFCMYAMVLAGALTVAFGRRLLVLLEEPAGVDAENMGYTQDYLRYVLQGAPFTMLSNGLGQLFRLAGLIRERTVVVLSPALCPFPGRTLLLSSRPL